ncbi:hypothetical protein K388_06045 [Streptomyces sp. KhCrAH-43]|nr:hypothetical protein [Streptomyces sp. SID4920]MYX70040.1 hypothetical protein [Streptomyces sp. SID8373]RAJ52273.1 hypothetical protein K388_06045 [Streptomyces sp. KhCrAH-43]
MYGAVTPSEVLDSRDGASVGYLLKDRVGQVEEFQSAFLGVARAGTVVIRDVIAGRAEAGSPERPPETTQGLDPMSRIKPLTWSYGCRGGGI